MEKLGKGIVGATIRVTITKDGAVWDLTGATVELRYEKPSGVGGTWAPTITDPVAGKVEYVTVEGDIDESDTYKLEPFVTQGALQNAPGDIVKFFVFPILTGT